MKKKILNDLKHYVASKKINRSSALVPIKKNARTKKICDYVFSDPHAHVWFSEIDREEYDVINIVIVPCSVEKMYRNSKMKQYMPYDEYVKSEANNPFHEEIDRDITVTNNFDERLWEEVDNVLEDMSILLDFDLPAEDNKKLEKK